MKFSIDYKGVRWQAVARCFPLFPLPAVLQEWGAAVVGEMTTDGGGLLHAPVQQVEVN